MHQISTWAFWADQNRNLISMRRVHDILSLHLIILQLEYILRSLRHKTQSSRTSAFSFRILVLVFSTVGSWICWWGRKWMQQTLSSWNFRKPNTFFELDIQHPRIIVTHFSNGLGRRIWNYAWNEGNECSMNVYCVRESVSLGIIRCWISDWISI